MNYRFYITALSSRVEVFPLNWRSCSLVDSREKGAMYYRRTFSGSLMFTDNNGGDDFSLLYLIEATSPCERLILEIEQKDSGADTYHNYWTGYFSTPDGAFDLDRSTFTITPKPYDSYINFDLYGEKEVNIFLAGGPAHNIEVSTLWPDVTYNRNFWLIDVIEYMVQQIEPAAVIASNFLNNITNPVTGDVNKWRYLTLAQKSDIKRPTSSNPATSGILTFNDLMTMLHIMNLYWSYDGTTFRIEHYDYFQGFEGINIQSQNIAQRQNKYSYLKTDMPMYEKFSFMEAGDGNFTPHTIIYDPNCTDKDNTVNMSYNVTTDIDYIYNCVNGIGDLTESAISDDGWVILANFESGGNYYVYYGTAYNSEDPSNNYVCSWSYLLRTLFMYGRVLMNGEIEGDPVEFISTVKTKSQNIKAVVCYEDGYDPNDYITTELGETWLAGQKGYVKQATIHPDGHIDFNLLYGEDKNTPPEISKYKIINIVVTLPDSIIVTLSEPNTVDTYFSLLFDDGDPEEECFQVIIPAGTVYQNETTLEEHTTLTGIYGNDPSLTGWVVVLNGLLVHDYIADCGVPPAPPEFPPTMPVLAGATQYGMYEVVHLNWGIPADTTYFEIYRSIAGGLYKLINTVPGTYSSYEDSLGTSHDYIGVEFCYKIKACNVAGCSAFSNVECWIVNSP